MVKVIVIADGKKIFEQEGEFFAGSVILSSDKNPVEAYAAAYGDSDMSAIVLALGEMVAETLNAAAEDKVEYVARMIKINTLLDKHIMEEMKSTEFCQKLAEEIQKIMEGRHGRN